uniref:Uncharacterized protein LOC104248524 n=1 Tax=Nicotiana sylvestris TaxID=4096 RepID=A0A1U7YM90_NICSY|nr:PREDICTED: uncharacterized protein LOC104248524 [Nicotiana sylvestris]
MIKHGYKPGKGLGKSLQGIVEPITLAASEKFFGRLDIHFRPKKYTDSALLWSLFLSLLAKNSYWFFSLSSGFLCYWKLVLVFCLGLLLFLTQLFRDLFFSVCFLAAVKGSGAIVPAKPHVRDFGSQKQTWKWSRWIASILMFCRCEASCARYLAQKRVRRCRVIPQK